MFKIIGSLDFASKAFRTDDNEVIGVGSRADETFKNLSKSKKAKNDKSESSTRSSNIGAIGEPIFLTPGVKNAFNYLKQAFTKAPILRHFDLECFIWIETDASGSAIGGILSQLSFDWVDLDGSILSKSDFGQWHPIAYFFRKIITTETQYKIHDAELIAIVEVFKTWQYHLESCKDKVLVLTDYNNLWRFMDTKNLSSCQIRWT